MTIYLYVKTHNITGLKYLGKTTQDPYIYQGSGKRWANHIKKHGYNVSTEILHECSNNDEIKKLGEYYSKLWNIVSSDEWANLTSESGDGGSMKGVKSFHDAIKQRKSISGKNNPMYGKSAVTEQNLKWYNNGSDTIYVTKGTEPDGYVPGRLLESRKSPTDETRKKMSKSLKGKIPPNRRKVISPDGIEYPSIKEAANSQNLTVSQFRQRCVKNGKWIIQ